MLIPNRLSNENAHMCVYVCMHVCVCVHAVIIRASIISYRISALQSSQVNLTHVITTCPYVWLCVCVSVRYASLVILASTTQLGAGGRGSK